MKAGQRLMRSEHAPPGFWTQSGSGPVPIDGIELESGVPTRFFQTLDAYPPAWGRLSWRVQLNKIVSDLAAAPVFRTFYPGVEWNLNRPDPRWFLTAWFRWEGPGPRYRGADPAGPPEIHGDTALFRIGWMPKAAAADRSDTEPEPDFERPLFLRSRIDARERRRISETLRTQRESESKTDVTTIVLDDIIEPPG